MVCATASQSAFDFIAGCIRNCELCNFIIHFILLMPVVNAMDISQYAAVPRASLNLERLIDDASSSLHDKKKYNATRNTLNMEEILRSFFWNLPKHEYSSVLVRGPFGSCASPVVEPMSHVSF